MGVLLYCKAHLVQTLIQKSLGTKVNTCYFSNVICCVFVLLRCPPQTKPGAVWKFLKLNNISPPEEEGYGKNKTWVRTGSPSKWGRDEKYSMTSVAFLKILSTCKILMSSVWKSANHFNCCAPQVKKAVININQRPLRDFWERLSWNWVD